MSVVTLKGVPSIGQSLLSDQLETNLTVFYDYTSLKAGNWFDVKIPTSGAYGGNAHKLRLDEDPSYTKGQVWSAHRMSWVWESGFSNAGISPIQISGVYVDGTFYPNGSAGAYAFKIDYPFGRIIFDTAIATNANVQCEFSYKWINWHTADAQWYKDLQFNSFRVDDKTYLQYGSGNWAVPPHRRLQMPAVVAEIGGRRSFKGYELGGGQIVYQDVFFHIFSEDHWARKQLIDVITYQNDKKIYLFNKNTLNFPLKEDGSLVANPKTYPDYISETGAGGHLWKGAVLSNMSLVNTFTQPSLFGATVRATIEVILGEI